MPAAPVQWSMRCRAVVDDFNAPPPSRAGAHPGGDGRRGAELVDHGPNVSLPAQPEGGRVRGGSSAPGFGAVRSLAAGGERHSPPSRAPQGVEVRTGRRHGRRHCRAAGGGAGARPRGGALRADRHAAAATPEVRRRRVAVGQRPMPPRRPPPTSGGGGPSTGRRRGGPALGACRAGSPSHPRRMPNTVAAAPRACVPTTRRAAWRPFAPATVDDTWSLRGKGPRPPGHA